MSLFRRTLLAVTAWLVVALSIVYVIADRVLIGGYESLERVQLRRSSDRATAAVQLCVDELIGRLKDWSSWDDTYAFVQDSNSDFIRVNLNDESQDNIANDAIWIADATGQVVWKRMRSSEGAFDEMPDAISEHISDLVAGLSYSRPEMTTSLPTRSGLIILNNEPYVFAAQPIITSARVGPSKGTIAFLRRFEPLANTRLRQLLLFDTRLVPSHAFVPTPPVNPTPGKEGLVWTSTAQSPMSWADLSDPDHAHIYVRLATLDHSAGPTLEIKVPREVYEYGRSSVGFFFAIIAVSALVLAAVSLLGLHMLVLRRVLALGTDVEQLADGARERRVREWGNDEIGGLSRRINQLLAVLGSHEANLRNRAEELELARQQAVRADTAKSQFLANMSHEIRTPMTAVLGYADLLLDPSQNPESRTQHVQTIRRNAEHLLTLIDDILDISKIEAGRMSIENVAFSPVAVCDDVHALLHARAAAKGIALKTEIAFPLPGQIVSDPTRLRQILVNLVGNAIKFTSAGGVLLHVSARRLQDSCELTFEVSDTGIGMSAGAMSRLFQPFVQADDSMTRRFGGTGLGLSISKRLAAMMGGDLKVSSAEGNGSTFTLTLHLADSACSAWTQQRPTAQAARAADHVPGNALSGKRILLAEDGLDNQRLFQFHLRKAGAVVEVAENGQIAAAMALAARDQTRPFDLILMDMQMPVLDGYGATSLLRQHGFGGPILALTAHAMTGDRERCLQAGCDDYLTKPIERAALIEACARWIANKPPSKQAA